MLKLIVGLKGSGKTKTLIELVNTAAAQTKGSVVCIEKGPKLLHEIAREVRLVDTDAYMINDAQTLFGAIAGILASNYDITDLFIDSVLKICKDDMAAFDALVANLNELSAKTNVAITATVSAAAESLSPATKAYMI